MPGRRQREREELLLHGWMKFFHRSFLFVTFPFRKPIKFVLIILFLLSIFYLPVLMYDVRREDLLEWYKQKTEPFISSVKEEVAEFKNEHLSSKEEKNTAEKQKNEQKKQKNAPKTQKSKALDNYTKKYKKEEKAEDKDNQGDELDYLQHLFIKEYIESAKDDVAE